MADPQPPLSAARLGALTTLAMLAFAGNSLLCRVALSTTAVDPASFTTIRILSGALVLYLLVVTRSHRTAIGGDWPSAAALFAYAAGFSFAYQHLSAATGALLLFGAVQCTMIGYGLYRGERPGRVQVGGILLALAGLAALLLPGLSAPPPGSAALMLAAGAAWGVYSLRGRGAGDATYNTAGNFVRAAPLAILASAAFIRTAQPDVAGAVYAVASGALASGLGYALWYAALPSLSATGAATVQLCVPALAAAGGVIFLAEPPSLRLALCALAILGGVAVFILGRRRPATG